MPSSKRSGGYRTKSAPTTLAVVRMRKFRESCLEFLNDGQFLELSDLVDRLENFERKRQITDLDIVSEGTVYKLTHTGTSLGNIIAEVFFAYLPDRREIVVLGAEQWRDGVAIARRAERMEDRLKHYLRIAK